MDIEIYRALNIPGISENGEPAKTLGVSELNEIIRNLRDLGQELEDISERFMVVSRRRVHETFYFDFDVIFSAINWLRSQKRYDGIKSEGSFWSSLSVYLLCEDALLLPGSLFELLNFLRRQSDIRGEVTKSAMAEAFIDAFYNSSKLQSHPDSFFNAVGALRNMEFDEATYFILKQYFSTAHKYNIEEGDWGIDVDIFQSSYYALRTGSRTNKPINNRVDALNFAICSNMNKRQMDAHHTLVSNSVHLRRLSEPQISPNNASSRLLNIGPQVVSTRHVCLYRLVDNIAHDKAHAQKVCSEWMASVDSMRRYFISKRSEIDENGFLRASDIFEDDALTDVVWMFEGLQKEISRIRHKQNNDLTAFKKLYKQTDHKEFLRDVTNNISELVSQSKYLKIDLMKDDRKVDIRPLFESSANEGRFAYEIYSDGVAVNVLAERNSLIIWLRSEMDADTFVANVVAFNREIIDKFYSETYSLEAVTQRSPEEYFRTGHWVFYTESGVVEGDASMQTPETASEVIRGLSPNFSGNVDFVRFDHPLYSISFDGEMLGFRTSYGVDEDFRSFLGGITEHPAALKSDDAVKKLNECAEFSELISLA